MPVFWTASSTAPTPGSRSASRRAIAALLALGIVTSAAGSLALARGTQDDFLPPGVARFAGTQAMLGSRAPAARRDALEQALRIAPGATAGAAESTLFSHLRSTGSAGQARYEADGLSLDVVATEWPRLHLEAARVVLEPSADGRSCAFDVSGVPFGATSRLQMKGTVAWADGPLGGDSLDAVLDLRDAPAEAVRALLPERVDPSVGGVLRLHATMKGVVGEATTEDTPATPLRGELELGSDWTVLGRRGPATFASSFSMDDRMVRLAGGSLRWQGFEVPVTGWFEPTRSGKFELAATVPPTDAAQAVAPWGVPSPWVPAMQVSGRIEFRGKPGDGQLRYEAKAPSLDLPALGGLAVHAEAPVFNGVLLAINAEATTSLRAASLRVGGVDLGTTPIGLQWWRGALQATTSGSPVWGGKLDNTISYKPAEHPAYSWSGRLSAGRPPEVQAALAPALGVEAEGGVHLAWNFAQDRQGNPSWTVHASLTGGRYGNVDLGVAVLDALASASPGLATSAAAALAPRPHRGGKGTAVQQLFVELAKTPEGMALGGLHLNGNGLILDGDGSWSAAQGLSVEATVVLPADMTAALVDGAPWLAALRGDGPVLRVPVRIVGPTSAPRVELATGFADVLAAARRGEVVQPVRARDVVHVGQPSIATIPGDPAAPVEW